MNKSDLILDYQEEKQNPEAFLASTGQRLANYILDRIGVYICILLFISITEDFLFDYSYSESVSNFTVVLVLLIAFGYWAGFEYAFGKTPAKFLTRTKVVTQDGERPTFLTIMGRTLCRFIPFEQFSFLGSRAVGWHDSISRTRVVRDEFVLKSA
ncbi:MAG: RDD family protein [Bacteroidota bacterium]